MRFAGKGLAWGLAGALVLALGGLALGWAWPRLRPEPLAQGRAAYARGDWDSALRAAHSRLSQAPADRDALRLLARALARTGRDDTAQDIYRRIGTSAMQAEDYYVLAAGLMRAHQRPDVVRSSLEMAYRLDPRHAETLRDLARVWAEHDQLEHATELARQLATVPGWAARGEVALALLLTERGERAMAADALDRALRLDPALKGAPLTPAAARKLLARHQLALGRAGEAKVTLETLLAPLPDAEASWLLSRALLQQGAIDQATAALRDSGGYSESHPMEPEPSPYAGAAKCVGCHPGNYRAELGSRHAKTFYRRNELGNIALPSGPLADRSDKTVQTTFERDRAGTIRVETHVDASVLRAVVDYAFGSGDRGLTFVATDAAGQPLELRLSRYNDGQATPWDRTTGHALAPADRSELLGKSLGAQGARQCLSCHTTNPSAVLAGTGPEAADHSIGCERCHGPGENHLKAVEAEWTDLAIARPRLASGPEIVRLCAQCHTPRSMEVSRSDPNAIRFQAATLTWSRCYTESQGALSCVSCHNPHTNAERAPAYYEAKCLACHSNPPGTHAKDDGTRPITLAASVPRTPCPVNATRDCVKCHMPEVRGIVPHTPFTDHHIRVHARASSPAER